MSTYSKKTDILSGTPARDGGRETTNRRAEKTILPEKLTINFSKYPPARYISNDDYSRNFIEYFMKERPAGKPFCFWLGFKEPHRPYEDGAGERGGKDLKSVEIPKYYPDHRIVRSDLADYAYECEHMDSHVKKVLDYLESVGELDNTLVVYTSDHGMPFPRVKGQIYEHGYNVPMAVRWGKNIKKPRVENTFINVRDFAPTFLELAGVENTGR